MTEIPLVFGRAVFMPVSGHSGGRHFQYNEEEETVS